METNLKPKQFYVYVHCKPDGTPFYVGKGTGLRSHNFKRRNKHHTSIFKKYGEANIVIYKKDCKSEKDAFAYEVWLIDYFKSNGFVLANKTAGGSGGDTMTGSGYRHSDRVKALISKATKGIRKPDLAYRNSVFGSPFKGGKQSEEAKLKIGLANKGRSRPDNVERNKSEAIRLSRSETAKRQWATMRIKMVEALNKRSQSKLAVRSD